VYCHEFVLLLDVVVAYANIRCENNDENQHWIQLHTTNGRSVLTEVTLKASRNALPNAIYIVRSTNIGSFIRRFAKIVTLIQLEYARIYNRSL